MLGFSKKKSPEPMPAVEEAPAAPAMSPAASIIAPADENFIVMPDEYLPSITAGQGKIDKKIYFLAAGAVVFLGALAGGLYFFFLSNTGAESQPTAILPPIVNTPPIATTTTETTRVISNEAKDNVGVILGTIQMTAPSLVANKYGEALGITVLSAADLSLPADAEVAGGIYSPYPVGVAFDEPIVVEVGVSVLATKEARKDYFPAYLKGAVWQAIEPFSEVTTGWSFSFSKFPSGPLAVIRRSAVATTTPNLLNASKPVSSKDTDGDGLTDTEESLLGTSISAVDSDGDTYNDRTEIFNNYSPLAPMEKLENAGLFTTYTNPTYGYKVTYPKKWLADALDQTNKQVLFISETEEFFEVLIEENPLKKPIIDWYRSQSTALANVQLDVAVVDGQSAVWSPDGLTLYIGKDGLVYIITYNKGTLEEINWPALFEYFYRSFKFGNNVSQSTTTSSTPPVTP
ncbi:MAG: hypothetical protein Q8L21_00395 [Candidatus Komeilibacteria bacterium]|nr:hypothetical protein [Candidatus Komeilibacteria bacterium]